jgi:hypothetical protein
VRVLLRAQLLELRRSFLVASGFFHRMEFYAVRWRFSQQRFVSRGIEVFHIAGSFYTQQKPLIHHGVSFATVDLSSGGSFFPSPGVLS